MLVYKFHTLQSAEDIKSYNSLPLSLSLSHISFFKRFSYLLVPWKVWKNSQSFLEVHADKKVGRMTEGHRICGIIATKPWTRGAIWFLGQYLARFDHQAKLFLPFTFICSEFYLDYNILILFSDS